MDEGFKDVKGTGTQRCAFGLVQDTPLNDSFKGVPFKGAPLNDSSTLHPQF